MELLAGIIFSFGLEAYKKLAALWGEELTKEFIYGLLFLCSVLWTILVRHNYITQEMITYAATVMAASIATFELVIKHLNNWFKAWQEKRNLPKV